MEERGHFVNIGETPCRLCRCALPLEKIRVGLKNKIPLCAKGHRTQMCPGEKISKVHFSNCVGFFFVSVKIRRNAAFEILLLNFSEEATPCPKTIFIFHPWDAPRPRKVCLKTNSLLCGRAVAISLSPPPPFCQRAYPGFPLAVSAPKFEEFRPIN